MTETMLLKERGESNRWFICLDCFNIYNFFKEIVCPLCKSKNATELTPEDAVELNCEP